MTREEEMIEKAIRWFEDIAEWGREITSGNVSHLAAAIRWQAIYAAEYLAKHKGKESDVEPYRKEEQS